MPSLSLSPFLPPHPHEELSLFTESKANNDLSVLDKQQSVIHKYVVDLISAGKSQDEVTTEIE